MARYFFHVMDGTALVDAEGTELATMQEVRDQAVRCAGEILVNEKTGLIVGIPWQMTVANEAGKTVFSLRFEANAYES